MAGCRGPAAETARRASSAAPTLVTIPGLSTFTARVLFCRNHYAGYWANDKGHGGQMWGVVQRQ